MNWLITGGCGFIGAALTQRLLGEGHRVRIVDNLSVGSKDALPMGVPLVELGVEGLDGEWNALELIVADIREAETARRAAHGAEVIVHLAGNTGVMPSIEDPVSDCHANVLGILNYLEAARLQGVKRFVFSSSGAPLGEQEPPLHEDMVARPISPYGASKLAGEAYCSAYWGSFGVETVALRFGNVFGPGSAHKSSVVAKFIREAMAGETLHVYGDGTQTRDFIYIDDLLDAVVAAGTRPEVGGQVFQIASQSEHTVNEVVDVIKPLVEARAGVNVTVDHEAARRGEVQRNYSDISKARRMLGFAPQVGLEEGVRRTLDYFLGLSGGAAGEN